MRWVAEKKRKKSDERLWLHPSVTSVKIYIQSSPSLEVTPTYVPLPLSPSIPQQQLFPLAKKKLESISLMHQCVSWRYWIWHEAFSHRDRGDLKGEVAEGGCWSERGRGEEVGSQKWKFGTVIPSTLKDLRVRNHPSPSSIQPSLLSSHPTTLLQKYHTQHPTTHSKPRGKKTIEVSELKIPKTL